MPSAAPYEFWLRGSNTFFEADTASEVTTSPTDASPNTIGEPSIGNGWIKVTGYAADPEPVDEGAPYTVPGGASFDDPIMREKFTIETSRYAFPSEYTSHYRAIMTHLSKRYLYIATSTYDVTLHSAGKVLAVRRSFTVEHTHEQGAKSIRLELYKREITPL